MSYFSLFASAALGFFDTPNFISLVQYVEPLPTFTGLHVLESERSRGQCWKCRRMIGKRGQSYQYVMRFLRGDDIYHACQWCHRKLVRKRERPSSVTYQP